ncbi:hypothetical protein PFISCL1PPCAC_21667, partial [Pristionchus fissidentatus]
VSPLFSSFSTMKWILALLLLPLLGTAYQSTHGRSIGTIFQLGTGAKFEEVDITGKVVCKAHNGSIIAVKDVIVELLEWNEMPHGHGHLLKTMKTDSSGEFRLIGGYFSALYLKFYVQYFYKCDSEGIRSGCPFIDEKCGEKNNGCQHQRIGHALDEKCKYKPPNRKVRCSIGIV